MAVLGVFVFFIFALAIGLYVLVGISHSKALSRVGYPNPWMAWIPLACSYAIADAASRGEEKINIIGSVEIPVMLYKLWWLLPVAVASIPKVGGLLATALNVIFLGHNYMRLYAMVEGKTDEECKGIGYVSGFFPIIAMIKFLTI